MNPPEHGRIEARLQFIQCPIVGRSRQAVRYNPDFFVLHRDVDHLVRVDEQEPVVHLDGKLLASTRPLR